MKISITRSGSELLISLRGDITEDCEESLRDLLEKVEVPSVVVDAEKIELINSLGARIWINFIQSLSKKSPNICFRRCSPAFIESCNTYPKFSPKNSILSLFLPARCESCGDLDAQLVERERFYAEEPLDSLQCPKCGQKLIASVEVEEFLQCARG